MTARITVNGTSPTVQFILHADVLSQDQGANTSVVRCYLQSINTGSGSSRSLDAGSQTGYLAGTAFGSHSGNPFLPYWSAGAERWMDGPWDVTVTHGSTGYATVELKMVLAYTGSSGPGTYTTSFTLPRIPKPPAAPTGLTKGVETTSSVALSWSAPDDNGSPITGYEVQYATDAGFTTDVGSQSFGGTSGTVTGLTPGPTYYFRVRAINIPGNGAYSTAVTGTPALPAPSFTSWAQNGSGGLVAIWTAPSPATGLTGYRLQVARDAGFTTGVQLIDLGDVLTETVTGLAGGRFYWARVAARTAGGVNTYSASRSTMLVLSAGDLDGWSRLGTKPAEVSYYTAEGIRRGVVGSAQALWLESLASGASSLAADTFGIQKTITGLIPTKAYRFTAKATLAGSPLATDYRLKVISEATGSVVTVSTSTELPEIEFVADSSTVIFQILLGETVTIPGPVDEVERIAFHEIRVLELATDYPQRLRETVYESNLANHFDLACNSVGATWYVGKDGVTRFRLPGAFLPVSVVFSDEDVDGVLNYVDVTAAYDTRGMVNRIEATNYGVTEDRDMEENDLLTVEDAVSIAAYGARSERIDLNLWSVAPYDESLADRLAELLEASSAPNLIISTVRWNAQQDLAAAAALEVGQRVTVRYRGADYDNQIVNIRHEISPKRWMIQLDLKAL